VGFSIDIVATAKENANFRTVVSTGPNAQVVLMSIPPGGEIGVETHAHVDQVLVFVDGSGLAALDGDEARVEAGTLIHVPAGTRHNVVNDGPVDLRLYTIYAPPQHAHGTIHRTKAEADADETDRYVPVAALR
jgi:mannose-6-phosphate isomerase-like protein (cupin superfamily)